MPKVSVIIPVYNTEKYLSKCLDSVLNQTLSDIEIICINDCSSDNSLKILNEYLSKDNRIRIIDFKENKGAASARNAGIDNAKGDYIGFVDSDDFVDLDFYEKLYGKAAEVNAEVVKGSLACLLSDGKRDINKEAAYDTNKLIRDNKAYFFHSFTTAVYSTNFLRKNNLYFPKFKMFEDPYFSINVSMNADEILVLDNAKYYYVFNSNSLTKTIDEKAAKEAVQSIESLFKIINEKTVDTRFRLIISAFLMKHIQTYCWLDSVSTLTNQKALDLYFKMYENFSDKEELIKEYFKQMNAVKQSLLLKFAKNKLINKGVV